MNAEPKAVTLTLSPIVCGTCGVTFGIESTYKDSLVKNDGTFYCTNGHQRQFCANTGNDKLQKKIQNITKQKEWVEEALRKTKLQVSAQKGAKTRLQNRIKNGVCPCCTRSFGNLERHMKTKHPEYSNDNP